MIVTDAMREELPKVNRVYVGSRGNQGEAVVTRDGRPFSPIPSQKVWNHSPDGFEWGYGGSGPAQLALAILLDATDGNSVCALSLYQTYKWRVVSSWPKTGWATTRQQVLRWICDQVAPIEPCPFNPDGETP